MTLLPAIRKSGLLRHRILSTAGGVSAADAGEKLDFEVVTTEETQVFSDREVIAVFILTRHSLHAAQIVAALKAGTWQLGVGLSSLNWDPSFISRRYGAMMLTLIE